MKLQIRLGVLLALVTLSIFALVQIWLGNSKAATPVAYLNVSAGVCSFLLPFVYACFGFWAVYKVIRHKALSFRRIFSLSATTQFIGGMLSLGAIFLYFNSTGTPAAEYLLTGIIQDFEIKTKANPSEELTEILKVMKSSNVELFSWRNFLLAAMVCFSFYGFISLLFAVFFKNRKI